MARFIAEPDAGVLALVMEYVATALNATQGLLKGERLLSLLRASPGTEEVLATYRSRLAELPWAVYEVRRTLSPRVDGRANHARSLRILDVGTRTQMRARLDQRASSASIDITVGDPAFPEDTTYALGCADARCTGSPRACRLPSTSSPSHRPPRAARPAQRSPQHGHFPPN